MDAREDARMVFFIDIDPSKIGTAQQKRFDPRTRRFFTSSRVRNGMRAIAGLARNAARRYNDLAGRVSLPVAGSDVALTLKFLYAIPKSRAGKAYAGEPCDAMWAGDCDNRAKAVIDALTMAGFWPDDRFVTSLAVSKRWTDGKPGIEVTVTVDAGAGATETEGGSDGAR